MPLSAEQSEVVKYIFEDTTYSEHGISDIISQMYNYNKRRLTIYLTTVLERHPTCCTDYLCLWKKAKKYEGQFEIEKNKSELVKSKNKLKELKFLISTYKNGARQIILRLLLDYIEETEYFEVINTISEDSEILLGSSFARKIITYLYRCVPMTEMEDDASNLGYIGFYTLLKEILVGPCLKVKAAQNYRNKIDLLARILYKMNSSSENNTHWCQLVIIKFKQEEFDVDTLSQKMFFNFENKSDELDYGVKITDAGRNFVEGILPNFEYFACRYAKQSLPLFTSGNLTITNRKSSVATELLDKISKQVFSCIDKTISQDMSFFNSGETSNFDAMYSFEGCPRRFCYEPPVRNGEGHSNEQCHPLRIIYNHISYIENYRTFILTYKKDDNSYFYENDIRKEISIAILNEIKKFIKKLSNIVDNKTSNNCFINGSPYVGTMNLEKEKHNIKIYTSKLNQAFSDPLNFTIRIVRN